MLGLRPGTVSPDEYVLVGAHYDHIPDCHGADDNATGVAATLEIARVLAKTSFERSTVIACWDEEEDGLVGSKAFIAALGGKQIVINFNFDMIGKRSDEPNSQSTPPGFQLVFADAYAEIQAKEFRGDFIAIITSDAANDHALAFAAATDRLALPPCSRCRPAARPRRPSPTCWCAAPTTPRSGTPACDFHHRHRRVSQRPLSLHGRPRRDCRPRPRLRHQRDPRDRRGQRHRPQDVSRARLRLRRRREEVGQRRQIVARHEGVAVMQRVIADPVELPGCRG